MAHHHGIFSNRKKNIFLFIFFLFIAAAARILILTNLRETVYFTFLIYDEYLFHDLALKIVNDSIDSATPYSFAPLFPYLMAAVYTLFASDTIFIRIVNIICGTLTCGIVFLITRQISDTKSAFVAMAIAALYEPLLFYSTVPLKASLTTLFFGVMVLLYLLWRNKGKIYLLLLCGVCLGALLQLRPHVIALFPAFFYLLIFNEKGSFAKPSDITRNCALFVLGAMCALSPFVLRNFLVAGDISLTTTQAGFNLYRANKLDFEKPVDFAETIPRLQEIQFRIEASKRVGKKITPQEASDFWKKETFSILKDEPFAFLRNTILKIMLFFRKHQLTDHYSIEFLENHLKWLHFPFISFTLLMPLGCAGLLYLTRHHNRGRELFLVFSAYSATLVILFMRTRYRLPLSTLLIPCASILLVQLYQWIRTKNVKKTATSIAFVLLFGLLSWYPLARDNDFTAYLNGHALALRANGKMNSAMEYWQKSSNMNGLYSDFANLALAQTYFKMGKRELTEAYLDKIPESSYAIAQKYSIKGDIYKALGDKAKAIESYQMALYYNSGMIPPIKKLITLYQATKDPRQKDMYERLQYIRSFYRE